MVSRKKKAKRSKFLLIFEPGFIKKTRKWFKKNYLYVAIAGGALVIIAVIALLIYTSTKKQDLKEAKKYIIISYNKVLYKHKRIRNKAILEGINAYETGYIEKAKFLFQSSLKQSLTEVEKKAALVNLANIFDDFTQYELAVKYLNKALEVDTMDGLIYHNLGIVYKHKKDYGKAVDSLLLAVKYNRRFVKSYLSLASLYFYLEDYVQSLKYYKLAGTLNPADSEIKYNIGICYFKLNEIDKGMKALEEIIHSEYLSDKIKNQACKSLGNYFVPKGNYKKALFYFKKATELQDDYDVHYRLGALYKLQGEYEKAMAHFEKAYKLNKEKDVTIKNLAELYYRFGEYDKAIKYYKYLLAHYKAKTEILLLLGELYLKKEDINQAVIHYKKALEFSPTPDEAKIAYVNLGNLHLKLQNYSEALDFYNKALEIDKLDTNIYYNISLIYLANKDFENALKNINEVIKLNPDDIKLYLIKSRLLYQAGEIKLSIMNYSRIIEKFRDEIVPYFELGNLYYRTKDYKNAEHYFNLALKLNPGKDYQYKIYANLSVIYNKKKEYEKAFEFIAVSVTSASILMALVACSRSSPGARSAVRTLSNHGSRHRSYCFRQRSVLTPAGSSGPHAGAGVRPSGRRETTRSQPPSRDSRTRW